MRFYKATTQQHLDKAAVNERLSDELEQLPNGYLEWQIITAFYSAVHLVQAYLRAKTNTYPQTHEERDRLIQATVGLRPIYRPYQELKSQAVTARYTCLPTNEYDVDQAREQLEIIKRHVASLLR